MNRGTIVTFQRKRANMSIAELSDKTDLSVDTIRDIEGNLRPIKAYELEAMAAAMSIPVWYLGDPNPMESRVYTYTHGEHVYNEDGTLTDPAEDVRQHLVAHLEMDEYLDQARKDGLMGG